MKVSLNWVKQFTEINLGIDELVQKIGAQLGAVEEVVDLGKKYQGIVIVKVVTCEKHPDADKLSVCTIDDGGTTPDVNRDEKGYVQVVCGAPNVKAGILAAWIPPGATVPSTTDKEPFVLEARELRGVVSNGMLASAAELVFSEDHGGLLVIDLDVPPGTLFAEAYELDDYIIDIENKMFTHRPDLFGMLGIAREIAGIQNIPFKSPEWYTSVPLPAGKSDIKLNIINEIPELVPRFIGLALSGVTVKPSPLIIQTYLSRVGLRPINNIVDITNYLMMLTGQPLHAYDYDKVAAKSGTVPTLVARKAEKQEKIKLLNGKEIAFDDPAILIATDKEPIGVGGVMGGADTEVDENTRNIILECANFDMYSIRRTSMKYGLFTDAVTRFNKGQSYLQNDRVTTEAINMIGAMAGGSIASNVFDLNSGLKSSPQVTVTSDFINKRLGLELQNEQIVVLLENVEFLVSQHGESLNIDSPFWRTDIEIKEDIVEEIGRLYGYDKLPIELPVRSVKPVKRDVFFDFKSRVRDILSDAGANEVLTYSFVHGDLLEKVGQDKKHAYKLSNAISPDLQYYRVSLTPSLLDKVYPNLRSGNDEFVIFEINKIHNKLHTDESDGLPVEFQALSLIVAASSKAGNIDGAAYFQAKRYLDHLSKEIGIELKYNPADEKLEYPIIRPFDIARSSTVVDAKSGKILGLVGEFKNSVRKNLKLPNFAAGIEIDLERLLELAGSEKSYKPLSKYPSVQQDITLKVNTEVKYADIAEFIESNIDYPANSRHEIQPIDIYQPKGSDKQKNITLRLTVASYGRTLTDPEVNKLLDDVATKAKDKLGAERI